MYIYYTRVIVDTKHITQGNHCLGKAGRHASVIGSLMMAHEVVSVVHRGQHGQSERSAATKPDTQQTAAHCVS